MSRDELTTTSYAILGLLSLRDWSTYELTQQMNRSMRIWWPRAESRVYEEPKRLVRLGLATTRDEGVGRRPRTVYSITTTGRDALEAWIGEPSGIFRLEFEAMLKVFFADRAGKDALLANIAAVRDAAQDEWERGQKFDAEYDETGGPFPERMHIIRLVVDLYERLIQTTIDWADDAEKTAKKWRSPARPR